MSIAQLQAYAWGGSGPGGSSNRRRQFQNEVAIKKTQHLPCLFREAPQLKTVGTVARVAGIERLRMEIQSQAIDADRGRPAEPTVAYDHRYPRSMIAVARGGTRKRVACHNPATAP